MLKYFINGFLYLVCTAAVAQTSNTLVTKNSELYKDTYGIRLGVDLSRIITSALDDNYKGLELVADYRLSKNLYIAAELGNENKTKQENLYNFNTQGSYLKIGIDKNTYANWYGEQNAIYMGARLGFSTFNNTLNNYQIFNTNRYWNPTSFAEGANVAEEFNTRTAAWLEAIFGAKVAVLSNLYLGASVRLGFLFTDTNKGSFPILWIPGFNKVTSGSKFGVGYNYTLSYMIPIYKKDRKKKD